MIIANAKCLVSLFNLGSDHRGLRLGRNPTGNRDLTYPERVHQVGTVPAFLLRARPKQNDGVIRRPSTRGTAGSVVANQGMQEAYPEGRFVSFQIAAARCVLLR